MAQATLINQAGDKKAVEVGSPEAQQLFAQGYHLMGSEGQVVAPQGQSPAGGQMVDPNQASQDAEMWQYLQGGDIGENPYMAFLQPHEVTKDGKRYLRIPKNQELKAMATFWEDWRSGRIEHRENFMDDYLRYRHDISTEAVAEGRLALDIAKYEQAISENDIDTQIRLLNYELDRLQTEYNLNKPYSKSGGGGDTTTPGDTRTFTSVSQESTQTGGFAYFGKTERGGQPQPITMWEYALDTNREIEDILAESGDPNDKIVLNKTNEVMKQVNAGIITADEALEALRTAYPHIYGTSQSV